jgi:glycerophosphoryl diester phosphodiesterase
MAIFTAAGHTFSAENGTMILRDTLPIVGRRLIRVGHRGAAAHAPGNTLASFRTALSIGVEMIEFDVRRCSDGELVLAHDATLPGPNGPVSVATTGLESLRALDMGGGERLLTLAEAIAFLKGRCALMIDLKGEGFEARLVETIHGFGLSPEDLVIPGGTAFSRAAIRALDPGLPLSLSLDAGAEPQLSPGFLGAIDTDAVTWHHRLITPERVAALRARGLTVYTWTVDDPETIRRVLAAGVDGIITNRPELLADDAH